MPSSTIQLRGVRVHNLKNIDIDLPRHKLIVFCGVSGSGKTSLAIDTLYAEAQRRYIESFSAYTRQFLARLDKPDFDGAEGLPPAIAVTRGQASRSNRSTVATATETYDYLRLLYAKIADLFCYGCGEKIISHSPDTVIDFLRELSSSVTAEGKGMIAFRFHWDSATDLSYQLARFQQTGLVRIATENRLVNLGRDKREDMAKLFPKKGFGWVLIDRFSLPISSDSRLLDSLETAFREGHGQVDLLLTHSPSTDFGSASTIATNSVTLDGTDYRIVCFNEKLQCRRCQIDYLEPTSTLFSFNSPLGACPKCEGFGDLVDIDMDLVVPDPSKSIREGAIAPWNTPSYRHELEELLDLADDYNLPVDIPYSKLSQKHKKLIEQGVPERDFGGLKGFFAWLERKKYKMHVRVFLSRWRSYSRCDQCQGQRLSPAALSYKLAGKSIAQLCRLEVADALQVLRSLSLTSRQKAIAGNVLEQSLNRLSYLSAVGLEYLTLDRTLRTLSGGESQRVALTAALGSSLVNMLYVLDEPTVGLHPADTDRLISAIEGLRDRGNTVIVVEHEEEMIERSEWMVEIGPTAGHDGGRIIYQGPTRQATQPGVSLTGEYLSKRRGVALPPVRRAVKSWLTLNGATGNNLQNVSVRFPLEVLCVVTGVSGSGKSSLVHDTLYGALCKAKNKSCDPPLPFSELIGDNKLDDVILIDQSPLSRSPRSNPITVIKAFDELRQVFADTQYAKMHNLTPGHFSFNSELGRCDNCEGDGQLTIDMQFMADISMRCPVCEGTRYKQEILFALYRDKSIAQVLEMTVKEAIQFFRGETKLQNKLQVLVDVGLGYVALGQSVTTLSAGENQRLKLAGHLASSSRKRTLFLMDEPTTGLHFQDIVQLLDCFNALIEAGHSLIIIEHNMQLIRAADYVIDIGPGAAGAGGRVIAEGTPEKVAQNSESKTARYLKLSLENQDSE